MCSINPPGTEPAFNSNQTGSQHPSAACLLEGAENMNDDDNTGHLIKSWLAFVVKCLHELSE